jgi:hypothetical protein
MRSRVSFRQEKKGENGPNGVKHPLRIITFAFAMWRRADVYLAYAQQAANEGLGGSSRGVERLFSSASSSGSKTAHEVSINHEQRNGHPLKTLFVLFAFCLCVSSLQGLCSYSRPVPKQVGAKAKSELPTWGYVAIGAGAGGLYYYYKHHQSRVAENQSVGALMT